MFFRCQYIDVPLRNCRSFIPHTSRPLYRHPSDPGALCQRLSFTLLHVQRSTSALSSIIPIYWPQPLNLFHRSCVPVIDLPFPSFRLPHESFLPTIAVRRRPSSILLSSVLRSNLFYIFRNSSQRLSSDLVLLTRVLSMIIDGGSPAHGRTIGELGWAHELTIRQPIFPQPHRYLIDAAKDAAHDQAGPSYLFNT